ncbi:lipocalin family protein [Flavobacterium sp.]|uniref:lipocalin family protein n=1 Tax=Flavobacterium sp. TaxID=239 RepID=UPI0026266E18|nr:lipocalin family protein [Flavobacterium sp.]MDD3003444.1 lipocalin family protein [Flavobacterium sp.]
MKKTLFYLSMLFLAISITACSKDDDKKSSSTSINGKWELSQDGMIDDGFEYTGDYIHECSTKKDFSEFLSNGNFTNTTYDADCNADSESGTYTYANNKLTITYPDNTEAEFDVVELTKTKLKIKIESSPGYGLIFVYTKQ